jgi:hypothetical protein
MLPALFTVCAAANAAEATTIYAFDNFSLAATTTTANADSSPVDFLNGDSCAAGPQLSTCGYYANFTTEFTVTPHAGYALDITGFSFHEWNGSSFGPARFDVFTSADAFTTSILGGTLPPNPNAFAFTSHATSLSLFGIDTPFTIRIVSSGHPGGGVESLWYLDNIRLDVEAVPVTTAVPEPATLLLLGSGLLGSALRTDPARAGEGSGIPYTDRELRTHGDPLEAEVGPRVPGRQLSVRPRRLEDRDRRV